jgi:16S rRNA U516 pseudouridylate synthase RsuA-like enzyme
MRPICEEKAMDEDRFNMAVRKFLKEVGVTSQREIERVVREGLVTGNRLRLRMSLTAEDAPLDHVVETVIELR